MLYTVVYQESKTSSILAFIIILALTSESTINTYEPYILVWLYLQIQKQ